MDKVSCRLSVFFEEPFWIGVFERISEGRLSVCKVTFGAEPKDYEMADFVLKNYYWLRLGTKSQQALKLQQEQWKTERKTAGRERREAEKQRRFELKQQKKKEKHRGR